MLFHFENSYSQLPERFYTREQPTPVSSPELVEVNGTLALELGLNSGDLNSAETLQVFAGNIIPEGSMPICLAYAGHQFGHFVPQLGDGRALLLGEILSPQGERFDIQLKGSGPTPFSRAGDGRAALGPVLREYLVSEAMHAMGIPTTRSLAVVKTGDVVFREQTLPGGILTRVASSHLRVGTFEYFAARGDQEGLKILADYAIHRHFPEAKGDENPYLAFLKEFARRQAELIAAWMAVSFIHGVMNTDNTSIAGETLDYGPCAFMDIYNPLTVFSSIDRAGRYAFSRQPQIAAWNLARFAETLLPLVAAEEKSAVTQCRQVLEDFSTLFQKAWLQKIRHKMGLLENSIADQDGDLSLAQDFLNLLQSEKKDYTLAFRELSRVSESGLEQTSFLADPSFKVWTEHWLARQRQEKTSKIERLQVMRASNPIYIPRNHLLEEAISDAVQTGDFKSWRKLLSVVLHPFQEEPGLEHYAQPPAGGMDPGYRTFCGT